MKLYEMANFIKKIVNYFIVIIIIISAYIYVQPIVSGLFTSVSPEKPPEIPYKTNRINFTQDTNLNFSISKSKIVYLGNPENQWKNLETKTLRIYEYNFSSIEDIDFTPKAKQVALQLGYDDLNQRDNAELSNKYVWTKNGLLFEINKVNKRMVQIPQQGSF